MQTPEQKAEAKAAAEAKKAEAKAAAKSGLKVLVRKASLLIGKKRIKKGERITAEEVNALPDKLKVLFADEAEAVETLKSPTKKTEEDEE